MNDRLPKVLLVAGLAILCFFVFAALFPQVVAPYGQKEMFQPWLGASQDHILGTNRLGYDIFTEIVYGTRTTLVTGLAASVLSLAFGALMGALSTEKGIVGHLASSAVDVMVMLPRLLTLIVLSSFLHGGQLVLVLLVAAFSWSSTARTIRARVLALKNMDFMENLRIQGLDKAHILFHHLIPNLGDILLSRFLLGVNSCIMLESTLSFLGFGDVYHPSWGTMVNIAYRNGAFIRRAYNYLLAPGVAIMLLSLCFYFMSIWFSKRHEEIPEA